MRFNRLVVIREGTDWVVWRGEHPFTRARVTVKQIQPRSTQLDLLRTRLQREYQFLNAILHKNLIRPTQLGNDGTAVAFEDTQGSLAQLIQQEGKLPVDQVANVMLQCLEGLDYLHNMKCGHGSMGPDTALLSPTGSIKLGDFTGYRFDQGAPESGGELKYQAPELIDASLGQPGPMSDLYCLGFLALELLTGDQFDTLFGLQPSDLAGDRKNWLGWHANPKRELGPLRDSLTHVPASLLDVITKLVQKDPAARGFKSAREAMATISGYGLMSQRGLPYLQSSRVPDAVAPSVSTQVVPVLRLKTTVDGESKVLTFPAEKPILVGRNSVCQLRPDRESVSDKHALFLQRPDGWWVYDLASTAGTSVNRKPISAACLSDGDSVEFAGLRYKVILTDADATPVVSKANVFGNFRLIESLHEGRGGQVFKAERLDKPDRAPVALRLLPATFQRDEEQIRRFLRGIPDAARFRNPNLVRLYKGGNVLKEDGRRVWFLAMEYMVGGSLRDLLRDTKPLPVQTAVGIGLDVANGIQAIAAEGRVHRGINPSCVLLDERGRAKLGDFFLLRAEAQDSLNQITQGALPVGDHAYQAPELLRPESKPTTTCDLYSLSAVLYEAVTGQPPFLPGKHLPETVRRVLQDPVTPPSQVNPGVPRAMNDLLLKGLAKSPAERFQTAEEFATALRGVYPEA